MNFKLDIKPLSVNEAWQGKRFKTAKYKQYVRDCNMILPASKKKLGDDLRIDLVFGFSSPLADLDNPVKLIIDILQKKYNFNDRHVSELHVWKKIVAKKKEFIEVSITNALPFG